MCAADSAAIGRLSRAMLVRIGYLCRLIFGRRVRSFSGGKCLSQSFVSRPFLSAIQSAIAQSFLLVSFAIVESSTSHLQLCCSSKHNSDLLLPVWLSLAAMPHPYDDVIDHMKGLDWTSRHQYIKNILFSQKWRTRDSVWSYVIKRFSPADFISGEATGVPPPPMSVAIKMKDAPKHYRKRQLLLTTMFYEQRLKKARKAAQKQS